MSAPHTWRGTPGRECARGTVQTLQNVGPDIPSLLRSHTLPSASADTHPHLQLWSSLRWRLSGLWLSCHYAKKGRWVSPPHRHLEESTEVRGIEANEQEMFSKLCVCIIVTAESSSEASVGGAGQCDGELIALRSKSHDVAMVWPELQHHTSITHQL